MYLHTNFIIELLFSNYCMTLCYLRCLRFLLCLAIHSIRQCFTPFQYIPLGPSHRLALKNVKFPNLLPLSFEANRNFHYKVRVLLHLLGVQGVLSHSTFLLVGNNFLLLCCANVDVAFGLQAAITGRRTSENSRHNNG